MAQEELSSNHWTEIIESKQSFFSLNIKEIWRYRDLILMFVKRDFITFYKQTILGPLWFIIQPLLSTAIFFFITDLANIEVDGLPRFLFILCGTVIWSYFSESLTKVSTVFIANAHIFGKVYFPRLIMPLSITISGLIRFAVQFIIFILVLLYYVIIKKEVTPNIWILITPLLIILMGIFALGLGMIFSSLTTKYKDLSFLLTFGVQLYMYATPVIFPISFFSKNEYLSNLAKINPLTGVFECFRFGYLGKGSFEPHMLIYSTISIILIFIFGTFIFNKIEKTFMDTV